MPEPFFTQKIEGKKSSNLPKWREREEAENIMEQTDKMTNSTLWALIETHLLGWLEPMDEIAQIKVICNLLYTTYLAFWDWKETNMTTIFKNGYERHLENGLYTCSILLK